MKTHILKTLFVLSIIFVLSVCFPFSLSAKVKFSKSKEKTAEDIPLDFTVDKTEWRHGRLWVWGHVRNKTNRPYEFVKITFTAWGGRGGDLLTRTYYYTEPSNIGPGEIGYIIDNAIECNNITPNLIEYNVSGREQ